MSAGTKVEKNGHTGSIKNLPKYTDLLQGKLQVKHHNSLLVRAVIHNSFVQLQAELSERFTYTENLKVESSQTST